MKNKKLLFSITKEDLNITYFSGTGSGGQNRNKNMCCVRINHKDSGVQTVGQNHKSRQQNTKEALQNLIEHPRFKVWHAKKVHEIKTGKTQEQLLDEMMSPENLKIETYNKKEKKWEPYEDNC